MTPPAALPIATAAGFAATLGASALLSRRMRVRGTAVDTDLTPAPPAFAIWGLIYALLGVLVVVQLRDAAVAASLGPWLLLSLAASTGWLLTYTLGPAGADGVPAPAVRWVSLAMLVGALAPAALATAHSAPLGSGPLAADLGRAGLSLYTGWLGVATALGVLIAALPIRPGEPARLAPAARAAAWAGLAAAAAVASWLRRDPLLLAPLGWAALWRAARCG